MKMLTRLFLVFLLGPAAFATPQIGDQLSFEDEELSVHGFYLSDELRKQMDGIAFARGGYGSSSANWDGIYAALVITNKELYLDKLWVGTPIGSRKGKDALCPIRLSKPDDQPYLFASWFTGELRYYHGARLGYTHVKTNVKIFRFEKGNLVAVREDELEAYERLKAMTNAAVRLKPPLRPQTNSLSKAQDAPPNSVPLDR